jgi:hypothetical protein
LPLNATRTNSDLQLNFAPTKTTMNKLIYISLALLLAACSNHQTEVTTIEEVVEAARVMAYFGRQTTEEGAVDASQVVAQLAGNDSVHVKLVGTIEKVCQVKGCWMTMKVNDDQNMHVSFKDYGFFVPKDIDGKESVIEGFAYMETMSVADLQHYAEDEGKTPEEIAMITEPETKLSFVADAVIVKDYAIAASDDAPAEETHGEETH